MKPLNKSGPTHTRVKTPPIQPRSRRRTRVALESLESRIVCSAGALDTSFNQTGMQSVVFPDGAGANAVAVQADGKVVLVGSSSGSFGTGPGFDVARLESNGLPDTTFGNAGTATFAIDQAGGAAADSATGVAVESTGDIVVSGTSPTSAGNVMTVLELTSGGTLDPSFSGGVVTIPFSGPSTASAVALTSNGEILVAGLVQVPTGGQTQLEFAVALLKTNGQLDSSFGNEGMTTISSFTASGNSPAVALQANGEILLAGNRVDHAIAVAKLTSNGTLDSTFGTAGVQFLPSAGTFSTFGVAAVAVQSNSDDIVIAGGPDDTGGPDGFDVARLTASGTLDMSFNQTGERSITDPSSVYGDKPEGASAVVVQPDGDIIVAGSLGDPSIDFELARIDPDGTQDETFGTAGVQMVAFNQHPGQLPAGAGNANALALTLDGEVVVAGLAQIPNGTGLEDAFGAARLILGSPTPTPTPPHTPTPTPTTPTPTRTPPHTPIPVPPPARSPQPGGNPNHPTKSALTISPKIAKFGKPVTLTASVTNRCAAWRDSPRHRDFLGWHDHPRNPASPGRKGEHQGVEPFARSTQDRGEL